MGKTKAVKAAAIDELTQALENAKGVAFVTFEGLKVKDITKLRRDCRSAGITYLVAKKTLLKLALAKKGMDAVVDPRELAGSIGAVFGTADEISAAKMVDAFAKDHPDLKFVGGLMPEKDAWRFLNLKEVTALAKLPSKQELIAKLVRTINNPVSGFVQVLSGNVRSIVQVLSAIRDSKV